MLKIKAVLLTTILLSGCSQFMHAPTKYDPPAGGNEVAKIRLMGNPLYYSIYQRESADKMVGGFVVEHNRFLNIGFGTTVDIGLPKIDGRDYSGKYFETLVEADKEVHVNYLAQNCNVTLKILPMKDFLYEVHYSDSDRTGYCTLYIRPVVFDKINSVYMEGNS